MEIIKFRPENGDTLKNFLDEILAGGSRPAIYLGFGEDGHPIIHIMPLSWKELAHLKVAFEMHVAKDWLGLMDQE